jgi:hypothetical protein
MRLRRLVLPIAGVGLVTSVGYGMWTLLRRHHLSGSTLPLLLAVILGSAAAASAEGTRRWRPITIGLLLLTLLNFASFYRDYFDDYRLRAARHFEGNRRGAFETVLSRVDRQHPATVFVSQQIQYGDVSWSFYTMMLGRPDLASKIAYFLPERLAPDELPRGAVVVTTTTASADADFVGRAHLTLVKRIIDVDGAASYLVFEKQ